MFYNFFFCIISNNSSKYKIIIVDNCSTDGTREFLKNLKDDSLIIVFNERNLGKGGSLSKGFSIVTGDITIIQDADLEYDPKEYQKLIAPIIQGNADVVYGNSQRMGLPMGYGGPHTGFFSTKMEYIRYLPGKLVSKCKTFTGENAYRMALQNREQHIKKDKATSNICTSQVLLSILHYL